MFLLLVHKSHNLCTKGHKRDWVFFTPVVQFIWSESVDELLLICIFLLVRFGLHRQIFKQTKVILSSQHNWPQEAGLVRKCTVLPKLGRIKNGSCSYHKWTIPGFVTGRKSSILRAVLVSAWVWLLSSHMPKHTALGPRTCLGRTKHCMCETAIKVTRSGVDAVCFSEPSGSSSYLI